MEVAERAFDAKPARLNGAQMRAAGDEAYVMPGSGQPGAEIAADSSGRHDRDPHGQLLGRAPLYVFAGLLLDPVDAVRIEAEVVLDRCHGGIRRLVGASD